MRPIQTKRIPIHIGVIISAIILIIFSMTYTIWCQIQTRTSIPPVRFSDALRAIAKLKAGQISLLLQGKTDRVVDFSSDGKIKDTLSILSNNPHDDTAATVLTNHLIANKLPIDDDFYEVYAMDLSGTIVASTNAVHIGTSLAHDTIYSIGKNRPYVKNIVFDKTAGIPYFNVSAPVYDGTHGLVGIIAIKMHADDINAVMADLPLENSNVEAYIINEDRYLITPSKYLAGDNKGVLAQTVETNLARTCARALTEQSTATSDVTKDTPYLNYAGIKTVGVYHISKELNWCILVEGTP